VNAPHIPDYELLRLIGSGSYGEVWLARGLTGVYRAVKVVWRNRFPTPEPYEREFHGLKEFTALSFDASQMSLLHVGQDERAGFFYYVMELADDAATGRAIDPAHYVPLTAKELKARRGRLPAAECVAFGVELARSLTGLHARRLLHRDIKPSNVIVIDGRPKLADIGLVASSTEARTFLGTEGYVPPEGPGSPAADVYALGKVLYELATGLDRLEFPKLPEDLGEPTEQRALFELNEILLQACEASAAQRYRDAVALLADLTALKAGRSLRGRRLGAWVLRTTAALIVIGAGAILFREKFRPADKRPPPAAVPVAAKVAAAISDKSIVVLPLENLSPDLADAYFTEGIHADIIAAVARVPDLKVISRNAALHFKDSKAALPEIARTLGVAHVITGSVRRVGAKVRIQLELRRASDEELLWSPTYDRELKDVLGLQSEVAGEVARVLQARQMQGFAASAQLYTTDPEAYDRFLKALKVLWAPGGATLANMNRSCELFAEIVQRDPKFAWAVFFLSTSHAQVCEFEPDPTKRAPHVLEAKRWAEAVKQLDSALGDAALSYYYTRLEGDVVRGLELAQRAVRLLPNDAVVHLVMGLALERLGRSQEALEAFARANEIDPFEDHALYNRLWGLVALRRASEFEPLVERFLAAGGGTLPNFSVVLATHRYRLRGEIPADLKDFPPGARITFLLRARRWDDARQVAEAASANPKNSETMRCDLLRWQAEALHQLGRAKEADSPAAAALELARKLDAANGETPTSRLAFSLMVAGRADEAVAAARRYLLEGARIDYVTARWAREETLARVLAQAGHTRESVALIKQHLALPSFLSVPMLRAESDWDNLRDDPEFKALLADPKNSAPL
jgi:TolB-like protein/Flp pilus assembly protein TadD